jgi:hypothetical protein
MSKRRIAQCGCGKLVAETQGEPDFISMCHCLACQKRSGSPLGIGAFFKRENVKIAGENKIFARPAGEGRSVINHFCPHCGSTVFWEADKRPGYYGLAVGAFADPEFPPPTRSVYEEFKHPWIEFGTDIAVRQR